MSNTIISIFIGLIFAAPFIAIHGWIRWIKCDSQLKPPIEFDLSLIGLGLSSSACALAALSFSGLLTLGGPPPIPRPVIVSGVVLSGFGVLFAFFGIWRRGPYRWQGFVIGLAMLFFWFMGLALRDIGPGF